MYAAEINQHIADGDAAADVAAEDHYRQAGEKLVKQKAALNHGEFGDWMAENIPRGKTHCNLCMAIYKGKTTLAAERQRIADANRRQRERKFSLRNENLPDPTDGMPSADVVNLSERRELKEADGETCQSFVEMETKHGRKLNTAIRYFEKLSPAERSKFFFVLSERGYLNVIPDGHVRRGGIRREL